MATTTSSGFALRKANGDILWFDAITALSEKYSAAVTRHPLASGSLISDHTTFDNPKFTISGILTDADFNLTRPTLSDTDLNTNKQYINNTQTVYPVQITDKSSINKILPEVIAQFTKDTIPDVYVTPQEKAKTAQAVKDDMVNMITNRELFTFIEFEGAVVVKTFSNCVLTGADFKEDTTTGEGIFPNLEFEQVSFAVVQNVQVKIKNKGRQTGVTTTTAGASDPATSASDYSTKSVTDFRGNGSNSQ
ncbi:hypothetical protein QUC26_09295 [Pseudomonas asiatica]|uniref:phage baseplate protein n=1 Tax=Pseudomonas asiatica TaxID=2219225 RepID=UPI0025A11524|nr:hypothetical protein [Pseudomonas asiatica]WJM55323.1 hypothetical protein QUC26_09295 [Pseudomonas asiatica]